MNSHPGVHPGNDSPLMVSSLVRRPLSPGDDEPGRHAAGMRLYGTSAGASRGFS